MILFGEALFHVSYIVMTTKSIGSLGALKVDNGMFQTGQRSCNNSERGVRGNGGRL
jgi:hypothetical protein